MAAESLTIALDDGSTVSGLWLRPSGARACLVLAHGAGADITHRSVAGLAEGLAARSIATLRYQFPFMERGSKRPDTPAVAQRTVRAAVAAASELAGELMLFAGGRSFGGRMTSQAQAAAPLPDVRGLVFFAFPLHPAGKASDVRAAHLSAISLPMLFIQGTRDTLADMAFLQPVLASLDGRATSLIIEAADHSFHVPAATGRRDAEVLVELLDGVAAWIAQIGSSGPAASAPAEKQH